MARQQDQIAALLVEASALEERVATWQASDELPTAQETQEGTQQYLSWYARALRVVPDDKRSVFEDMYEGGLMVSRIRAFLSSPLQTSPLWDPDNANPLISKFTLTFERHFKENFDRQVAILTVAMESETAVVAVLDELTAVFQRLPEYLGTLSRRSSDNVPAPRITNEADLQIVVEAILRLLYADVRPEDFVPEYAGGRSRVDFLLREAGVVIETKMTRQRLRDREVGEELTIDWMKYRKHPDCRAILAVVYDPDRLIANPGGLEHDLSDTRSEPATRVIVVR